MSNGSATTRKLALPGVTSEQIERNRQAYTDIVARYFGNPEFRGKVDADPARVLREEGLDIPEGVEVKILFNSASLLHLVLPAPAGEVDATDGGP